MAHIHNLIVCGELALRPLVFGPAGSVVEGHTHNFDHMTYITHGKVRVEKLGDEGKVLKMVELDASEARNFVNIEAGVIHRLTSLTDGALGHCVYPHRDPETNAIVRHYNGWEAAYV